MIAPADPGVPRAFLNSGLPILDSRDLRRSVRFYARLGFMKVYLWPGRSAVVQRDDALIHFWACPGRWAAAGRECRLQVSGLDAFYEEICGSVAAPPRVPLQERPWGTREFGIADEDGNLVTFFQWLERPRPRNRRRPMKSFARP
jgi:catechol 2,3-dioxygenase-like lactoylglutathione lyase family enzyme